MSTIYPCLWFNNNAKEAATFYCSVFKTGKITSENPIVVMFEINNTTFMALNGGNKFSFNEAVSFVINCENQAEIDHYWKHLSAVPEAEQCGWCKDKFGVSWQIVPRILGELMADKEKAPRVIQAFLKMKKFDIEALLRA